MQRHSVLSVFFVYFVFTDEVTGERRCSYEALKKGSMTLDGLPLDINFTNPWMAGKRILQRILELKDKIYFKRMSYCNLPCFFQCKRISI
jgi:hypothetical protein